MEEFGRSNRHIRMDLSAVAWGDLLSQGMATKTRTGICVVASQLDRNQRLVLFASSTGKLPGLVNATPEGFLFSVKGGRFITHFKRLKEVETPLANFFGSSSSLRPQSEKRIGNRVKVALLPLAGGVYQSVRSERRFAFPNCLKNPANSGPVPTAKSPHQSESRRFPHYRVLGF